MLGLDRPLNALEMTLFARAIKHHLNVEFPKELVPNTTD